MKPVLVRVVKVGGSLLDWPALSPALAHWLAQQSPAHHVFIAGGGPLVRKLAAQQEAQGFDDETAHWLAVEALEITAPLLHSLLPAGAERIEHWPALLARLARSEAPRLFVLHVRGFLRELDALSAAPLPCDWSVTSDSIAARVAANLSATELVLLKSVFPPSFTTLSELSDGNLVDGYFPVAAAELPRVRLVNLREAESPEGVWEKGA